VIRVESLQIIEFRGIRKLTLNFNGKNFAIGGPQTEFPAAIIGMDRTDKTRFDLALNVHQQPSSCESLVRVAREVRGRNSESRSESVSGNVPENFQSSFQKRSRQRNSAVSANCSINVSFRRL